LCKANPVAAVDTQASPFAGCVLVVDDMHEDAQLLAEILAPLGASVVVARSAAEALSIVDQRIVDLVVTDLNMPVRTGLDLAGALRLREDAPDVIFMTGSSSYADKVAAFALGAVAYLPKPIDVERLLDLARKTLDSRCARHATADMI